MSALFYIACLFSIIILFQNTAPQGVYMMDFMDVCCSPREYLEKVLLIEFDTSQSEYCFRFDV